MSPTLPGRATGPHTTSYQSSGEATRKTETGCLPRRGCTTEPGVAASAHPGPSPREPPVTRTIRIYGLLIATAVIVPARAQEKSARVEVAVLDKATGRPLPCRIHIKDAAGKPQRPAKLPFWNDHFVCPGTATLELPEGRYTIEIDRGPEHQLYSDAFGVDAGGTKKLAVALRRLVDLPAAGWWPGDLHVHRPVSDIELLMKAEDLHIAPVITWWNKQNPWAKEKIPDKLLVKFDEDRFYHVMGGEDEREGGALLFFHLPKPLEI